MGTSRKKTNGPRDSGGGRDAGTTGPHGQGGDTPSETRATNRGNGKGRGSQARGTTTQRVERLASAASEDAKEGVSSVAGNQPKSGGSHGADAASRVSADATPASRPATDESDSPRAVPAGASQAAAGADEHTAPLLTGLDARQDRAILALLAEPTVEKAAEAAGVSPRTLHRWLAEPTFSRAFCEARRRSFRQAIALTHRYAPLAVQTLARVLADHGTSSHARVHAASVMLRFSRESIELDDLAERLDELERRGGDAGV